MEIITLVGIVLLAHALAVISPGPDFIVAVKNSLAYSRKTGLWTAIGIGLGIMVHVTYCIAGIAFIISQSIILFSVIKLLGAGYLIYIGSKALLASGGQSELAVQAEANDLTVFEAIRSGFLTNVLNPKATLFFLSLFTMVITPSVPLPVLLLVSLFMVVNTTLWFSLVAVFFTQPAVRSQFGRFQPIFDRALGGLLIILGFKVALMQR